MQLLEVSSLIWVFFMFPVRKKAVSGRLSFSKSKPFPKQTLRFSKQAIMSSMHSIIHVMVNPRCGRFQGELLKNRRRKLISPIPGVKQFNSAASCRYHICSQMVKAMLGFEPWFQNDLLKITKFLVLNLQLLKKYFANVT